MTPKVLAIILGGGKGTRLFPLTKERSKPAVPFGGKYRIVDIPISNCINSDILQVYLLTQFNSASLHMHIANTYNFDRFSHGFVEILAAEQTLEHSGWYEGTADAVRKNFVHFRTQKPTHYIILSGDQLYRMNLRKFLDDHIASHSDISIATTQVTREDATGFGIMKIDKTGRITEFMEKPAADLNIDDWKIPAGMEHPAKKDYLASMGIYIFNADVMESALDNTYEDFGKQIIPAAITNRKVQSFIHSGYWEDIGTIKSFFDANIDLTSASPSFNFYDEVNPIYTAQVNLPPSKILNSHINNSITSEGCIIDNAKILHSVIGVRSIIREGSQLENVVFMGAAANDDAENGKVGVGKNCKIARTIVDKNACIGDNCSIGASGKTYPDGEIPGVPGAFSFDGIIVIKKDAVIPANTTI
ncbi:MAG: glucose-1-phosphate adenylyltransferase [Treponemataceae bacterium]|nr:MAG: glucose-1-phosphate adenylyltransferase [Treponemataceae bacterium]